MAAANAGVKTAFLAAVAGLAPAAAFAQTPAPAPPPAAPVIPAPAAPPPLPNVPQVTPPATDPATVSPATPGTNLDAPAAINPPAPTPFPTTPAGDDPNLLYYKAGTLREDGQNHIILEGNVEVRYQGYRVRADRLIYDKGSRVASFEGNVVVENDPISVRGDLLRLNLRTREFQGKGGQSVIPTSELGGNLLQPLRVSGTTLEREIRGKRGVIEAADGFLTTCDYDRPHYRIGYRRLSIIPGKRVALRNVKLYFGDRVVLRLRYLSLPLNDRQVRYSYLPQFGRTEEEGFYVKAAFGYALSDLLPGIARIDLMQKKGIGLGFDQDYRFGGAALGALALYTLNDRGRGVNNLNGRINHTQRLDSATTLNVSEDFQQNSYQAVASNSKSRSESYSLARNAGGTVSNFSLNRSSSNYGQGTNTNSSYTLAQTQTLGRGSGGFGSAGSLNLRLSGTRSSTPGFAATTGGPLTGGSVRETQNGDLRATGRLGIFDAELNANKNLKDTSGGGFFGGTEKLPELLLNVDGARLFGGAAQANSTTTTSGGGGGNSSAGGGVLRFLRGAGLRLGLGYGRYVEAGVGGSLTGGGTAARQQTDRALFNLDANPQAIPLPGRFSLQMGGSLRQTFYGADAAQYVLSSRNQLTQRLGPASSLNFTYGYLRPYGYTPLLFDQSGSLNNAGANLNVETSRLRLTVFTGYDIQQAQADLTFPGQRRLPWQNLSVQLGLKPSAALQTRFTAAYDINTGRLRDLSNRLRIRTPGGFALDTGVRYDPERHTLAQANAVLETPLFGGSYNVSALAGYNGFTKRFDYKSIALTRSYHDYEITLSYADQPFGFRSTGEKGFNLLIRLKALPVFQQQGVGRFGTALDTGTGEVF